MKIKRFLFWLLLVSFCLFLLALTSPLLLLYVADQVHDDVLKEIIAPYHFYLSSWHLWEVTSLFNFREEVKIEEKETVALVERYFCPSTSEEEKEEMLPLVEGIIRKQVGEALREAGIVGGRIFPSLNFKFDSLPTVLIISPRDQIKREDQILLIPDIPVEIREEIEVKIDEELDVSSLITNIGGVATYPSLIGKGCPLKGSLETIIHEWTHQYLFFKPLGFYYALDVGFRDIVDWLGWKIEPEIGIINETVATIVGREIANEVYFKHYSTEKEEPEDFFKDFYREPSPLDLKIIEIREKTEYLLKEGKVIEAEEYMRKQRNVLEEEGFYIRKINQAYFAWYSYYAYRPDVVCPIGERTIELREDAESLRDFVEKIEAVRSVEDLWKN